MKHAVKHIHFVGIGGSGMSGIAEVLHNLGYTISGSDQSDSTVVRRLAGLGIRVAVGHNGSASSAACRPRFAVLLKQPTFVQTR